MRYWVASLILLISISGAEAADRPPSLQYVVSLYGDNTEFLDNPYREGETLLGTQNRLSFVLPLGERSQLRLGVFTDNRWGSDKAFELVRPVLALEVGDSENRFILGTLHSGPTGRPHSYGLWPDESGPHGLVPALELDTLSLTRGFEAGLQWLRNRPGWKHDVWLSWQNLNTPKRRERFDAGMTLAAELIEAGPVSVSLLTQGHVVHEGGQLYSVGAVGDSMAGGPGFRARWSTSRAALQADILFLFSSHNPDRADTDREDRIRGNGRFVRLSWERADWRAAFLCWRTRKTFIKWEGDSNYSALVGDDLSMTARSRTYDELSLARRFRLSPSADLVTAARLYWIDGSMDYSYRVAATIHFQRQLTR